MRLGLLASLAFALGGCSNPGQEAQGTHPVATIVDLSTSVAELARDFDSHAGEPRFVMLLSPT